jgi:hypothetical protein
MKIAFTFLLCCLIAGVFAGRPHLQFGGQVGVNYSSFIDKLIDEDKSKLLGYQGGFFFRISKNKLHTQFNLDFIRNALPVPGRADTYTPDDVTNFAAFSVGIPIQAGYIAVNKPLIKYRLFGGIEPIFYTKLFIDDERFKNRQLKLFVNPNLTMLFGTGIDIAFFTMDFRYNLGLTKVYREIYRSQSHFVQITTGVLF